MSYVPPQPPAYPPTYETGPRRTYMYEPTQEERTFGTLSHALQMAGGWIAPLVIFLSKKQQSRFVAFHSLQALLLQLSFLRSEERRVGKECRSRRSLYHCKKKKQR